MTEADERNVSSSVLISSLFSMSFLLKTHGLLSF